MKKILVGVAVLSFAIVVIAQTKLPEGEGKQLVQDTCASSCHGAENWSGLQLSKEDWFPIVQDMANRGEGKTDAEINTMATYLAKNFGPEKPAASSDRINVNKAASKELGAFFDLSAKEADAIVQYREKNGDFKGLEDLKKVPDIDVKKLEAKKDRLDF